ncbi:C-type lectin domain-containing protein [Caenorhabditis elegans]|uniref:C-type lectin domain-containing protein n=1 Tax=Caenorhabditis elegans TaxID=6239 RepID=G3MU52_CAEEL|nr:C-type lectin domain-containing protein [Caenorhabditis elegans]CCD31059.1 C-type lectin domain-containing protein [Caenorhabditis elegans]|eukprot:NP_001252095.1 C-type LECtin [Caenorhabditis elegans]
MRRLTLLLSLCAVSAIIFNDENNYRKYSSFSSSSEERIYNDDNHERPQGRWCMKAFYGNMFQPEAEAKCNAVGARLSGLQNANERMTISYVLRGLIYQHGGGRYTAWLGGKRRARCPTGTSCARLDSIEWTDGHTTGTAGFSTGPRELDGYYLPQYGGVQQCLHMIVTPYSNTELGFADFVHESVDDEFCQATWVKAYVCGKLPS